MLASYGNLGTIYQNFGDYAKDIELKQKALEIAKQIESISVKSRCYRNLGIIYSSLGDKAESIN